MNPLLATLSARASALARGLAAAGVGGLLLLALGTAADVLLRYVFAAPIRGFVDVVQLAGAVSLAACMPYALTHRAHIQVELLGQHLLPRQAARLAAFGQVLTVGFFVLMAWQLVRFAREAYVAGEAMPVLRWPIWPWWAAAAACIVLAAVLGLLTLAHDPRGPARDAPPAPDGSRA